MNPSRRQFLRLAGYGLSGAAFLTAFDRFAASTALARGPDYRALVCIFLFGGNDGDNTVVSLDNYADYYAVRNPGGLAIPQNTLLPITTSIGNFGFHPSLPEVQTLYNQGKLAVVCNVGTLVVPLTRQQYLSGGRAPSQLFSHSDQANQWASSRSDQAFSATGWGGRIADRFPPHASGFPMVTSISGSQVFANGASVLPLVISPATTALNRILVLNGFGTGADEVARRQAFDYFRTLDRGRPLINSAAAVRDQSLQISAALNTDPTLQTVFPNTRLGNQLKQVAKVMKANQTNLGLKRQIFFCSLDAFDTHGGQADVQASLLTQVSRAMAAFYNATVELGLAAKVTTFTMSDFGRTLQPSSGGTDHGWGNHHLVMGDAVVRNNFFGVPGPNGTVFPTQRLGGPNDADGGSTPRGRWIPTAAVEQYGATLASWYGVREADMPTVFPLLRNFTPSTTPYLGFLRTAEVKPSVPVIP